jgi:hypothetical protein
VAGPRPSPQSADAGTRDIAKDWNFADSAGDLAGCACDLADGTTSLPNKPAEEILHLRVVFEGLNPHSDRLRTES